MEEELITFETAKLAKEKGFDVPVKSYFYDGDTGTNILREEKHSYYKNYNGVDLCYSIPTQSLLQKWLREKHKICMEMEEYYNLNDTKLGWYAKYRKPKFNCLRGKTYEEALEKGLQEALKLIK